MKTTGIVRRIDDLGRVVIPKEVRRTLHIHEGDPLELFVDGNTVCFKKYNHSEDFELVAKDLSEMLNSDDLRSRTTVAERGVFLSALNLITDRIKNAESENQE